MTTLTVPGVKVQGHEFNLNGGRTWSGSIPLRGFYGLRSRFFFFFRLPTNRIGPIGEQEPPPGSSSSCLFLLGLATTAATPVGCPPSDDQPGPAGLSPLLPIKRIISNLRTCATLGLAVDLQTRQVVPPASPLRPPSLPPPPSAPDCASALRLARPRLLFLFYLCQVEARLFPISKLPAERRSRPTCH